MEPERSGDSQRQISSKSPDVSLETGHDMKVVRNIKSPVSLNFKEYFWLKNAKNEVFGSFKTEDRAGGGVSLASLVRSRERHGILENDHWVCI
ncbi:MAG: hypothetical protein ACSHYF_17950 [Verrucomicrobiaceae bacterium]